jgi:hypothetical protein
VLLIEQSLKALPDVRGLIEYLHPDFFFFLFSWSLQIGNVQLEPEQSWTATQHLSIG